VKTEGDTVGQVLDTLGAEYPSLKHMIYDDNDQIPGHINIYVNNQEINSLQGKETPVKDGDELAVIPAIAGGSDDAEDDRPRVGALTPEQVDRYSRHIIMPQVGPIGQRKLMEARVLIVGAGGLGGPVALYLALAGVGTIGIVEFDTVDLSNLQRQVLHQNDDVGKPKAQSAMETIHAYNPDINVVLHEMPLTSDNAMEIIPQYDIVVNGADNFTTRYLVNDAAYFAKKILIDGAILLFDGQATVYVPGTGCYRCLFPAPPRPAWCPVAPKPASSVRSPASWAPFRPPRRSR
jgi:adenylyltransferase/sulfurtransferase